MLNLSGLFQNNHGLDFQEGSSLVELFSLFVHLSIFVYIIKTNEKAIDQY